MKELIELIKIPFSHLLEMRPKSISKSYYLLCINIAWLLPILFYGVLRSDRFLCEHYYGVCGILCLIISLLISLTTFKIGIENATKAKLFFMKSGHGIVLFLIAVVFETCIVCPLVFLNNVSKSDSGYIALLAKANNCGESQFLVIKPWLLKSEWEKKDALLISQQSEIALKDSIIKNCNPVIETYLNLSSENSYLVFDEIEIAKERFVLKLYYLQFNKSFLDSSKISKTTTSANFDFYAVNKNSEFNKSNNANNFPWAIKTVQSDSNYFTFSFPINGLDTLTLDLTINPVKRDSIKISIGNFNKYYALPPDTELK